MAGATLSYTDGTPRQPLRIAAAIFLPGPLQLVGAVTPSKTGYDFIPATGTYTNVTEDQSSQDYTTTTARVWYVDKTNPSLYGYRPGGFVSHSPSARSEEAPIWRLPGQIVHVLHGTYAESVLPERSGTAGNPISYLADPGVTVTGTAPGTGFGAAFGLSTKSYIVIDGFTD